MSRRAELVAARDGQAHTTGAQRRLDRDGAIGDDAARAADDVVVAMRPVGEGSVDIVRRVARADEGDGGGRTAAQRQDAAVVLEKNGRARADPPREGDVGG